MDLKKFAGRTIKEMKFVNMKLVVTFENGEALIVESENSYCGLELFEYNRIENVQVKVYDFIDGGVDYGWFIGLVLEGFTNNGEEDAQNEEINEVFEKFGLNIDFKKIVLENNGYIDTYYNKGLEKVVEELFFRNKEDAEKVAEILEKLLNEVL